MFSNDLIIFKILDFLPYYLLEITNSGTFGFVKVIEMRRILQVVIVSVFMKNPLIYFEDKLFNDNVDFMLKHMLHALVDVADNLIMCRMRAYMHWMDRRSLNFEHENEYCSVIYESTQLS